MIKVVELARDLVEISSPSGEEKEICTYVAELLEKEFKVERQKIGNRFNIFATNGKPKLLLTTHLDTVPGKLEVKQDKKYLYGRGACDAKGSAAAMIFAALKAKQEGYTDFALMFDVGEELDFLGIKDAIKLCKPELVILGEPTQLELQIGQKGLLGFKLISRGKSAHGATPEKGESAILKLTKAIEKLSKLELPVDKVLGKATLNIGLIKGGSAANSVPDYAEASVEIRTVDTTNLIAQITEELGDLVKIRLSRNYAPYKLTNLKLSNKLMKLLRSKTFIAPFFTEQYFWSDTDAVVIGPGDPKLAHSANEKIELEELRKGVEAYLSVISTFARRSEIALQSDSEVML